MSDKCAIERRNYPPGEHGRRRRRRPSDYSIQLREKQKVKRIYGVLERQFRRYFSEAARERGITGQALLTSLERRLDNVVFRMGLGLSRPHARQLVKHGHVAVNGKRVDIPSYRARQGDQISIREGSKKNTEILLAVENAKVGTTVGWVDVDGEALSGTVTRLPTREDIDVEIQEQLIVELYSK
jgi:small subunit ribosomal protein S4